MDPEAIRRAAALSASEQEAEARKSAWLNKSVKLQAAAEAAEKAKQAAEVLKAQRPISPMLTKDIRR